MNFLFGKSKEVRPRGLTPQGKVLVMYSRTMGCPYISIARRVLEQHKVTYHEIFIDRDDEARQRVLEWTGFLSVPTLVVAAPGEVLPQGEVAPLAAGASPSGIDRGPMITEANAEQLEAWLTRHGFLEP